MNYSPPTKTPFDFGASLSVPFGLHGGYGRKIIIRTAIIMTVLPVIGLLLAWPMIAKVIPTILALADNPDSPDAVFGLIGAYMHFIGVFSIIGLLSLVVSSSAEAALLAGYLRGDVKSGFPLLFNGDMWRVIGAKLLVGICVGAAFIGVYIIAVIFGVIIAIMAENSAGAGGIMALLAVIAFSVFVAGIALVIWLSVRLSTVAVAVAVAAVAVRDQKFDFGAGFRASKGRVWPMIGGFLIIFFILGMVQNVLMYGGLFGILGVSGIFSMSADFAAVKTPGDAMEIFTSLLNPAVIILSVNVIALWSVVSVIGRLCMAGVPAHVAKLDDNINRIAETF